MSVEAMSVALHHSRASGTTKLVLLGIANHDGDGGAWPSLATLARYAGRDVRSVRRAIAELVELGEVSSDVNAGGTQSTRADQRPNLYRVLLTCPAGCDRTTAHRVHPGPDELDQSGSVTVPNESNKMPNNPPVEASSTGGHQCPPVASAGGRQCPPAGERADIHDRHGRTPVSAEPSLESSLGGRAESPRSPARDQEPSTAPQHDLGGRTTEHRPPPQRRRDRCARHQDHELAPPCGGCAEARKALEVSRHEFAQASEAERRRIEADARRVRLAAIRQCAHCDSHGYADGRPCTHDPDAAHRAARGAAQVRASIVQHTTTAEPTAESSAEAAAEDAEGDRR